MKSAAARWADVAVHDTLPKVLRRNAKTFGDETALREKKFGIWNSLSWKQYARRTEHLALAFADMGIGKGDVVAILGGNGCYWLCGALAAQCCGATSFGVYGDAAGEEARRQIAHTGAKIVVAEDEEQADKLLPPGGAIPIPEVRKILYNDPRGMRKYDDPRLLSMEDASARGARLAADSPRRFDAMIDAGDGDDSAMLISTSGATAAPKCAEIAHGAFLRHVIKYLERDPKTAADEYVSALPPPWVMEITYSLGKSLACRMKINFAESPATLTEDLREIGPTFLLLAPRSWERIAGAVRARMADSSALKRALFHLGMKAGLAAAETGGRSRAADFFVFRALRDALGFSRLTSAATGGAALGPDAYKFFIAMGVPLKQLYGQTELLGAYAIHSPGDVDYETSGRPFDGVEIKITDADSGGLGKIFARNPNMMRGYFKAPEETAKVVRDGWMDTGDAGYFKEGGHLVVADRRRDLSRTAGDANFSPQYLENKLKFSPHISEAVVFGNGRDFLTALVCIRAEVTAKWAERRRIAFTSYADLSLRSEVRALVRADVAEINAALPPPLRLRRIVLLPKELDAADGELTHIKTVRRDVVAARCEKIVDALYSGAAAAEYGDAVPRHDGGRRTKTVLQIEDLDG
ncbi:MAG: AMP-binding protein [Gammaproteobacteria bacterium]